MEANTPKPIVPATSYWLTRFVILRLLGLVYLVAFLVSAHQLIPLVGEHGLLPARQFLDATRDEAGSQARAWIEQPTLFWIDGSDPAILVVSWTGAAISLLLMLGFGNAISLFVLWLLYLSIVNIGQDWYSFGWESQLLETGFLAMFLCPLLDPRPFPRTAPPATVVWLLRWLIFRVMLGAGLIKLRGDACWTDLTALCYHYETQPIPNALSRWLHFLPRTIHGLECLGNHLVELVVPWFAWWPATSRRVAGAILASFQVCLILSGNLAFLNWLTIVPCLACLDDGVWRRILPRRIVARAERAAAEAQRTRAPEIAGWALLVAVAWLSIAPVENLLSREQRMNMTFNQLHLVNTYGAFGAMDKVRYELVFEGTYDEDITPTTEWREYPWKAKPGDPRRTPPWISPYHYRLDWQAWFAAKSSPGSHPWAVHLLWKLLHNDEGALSLLAGNPFPERPPHNIRVERYEYRFARPGRGDAVWTRRRVGEWIHPMSICDVELRTFLAGYGWLDEPLAPLEEGPK